MHKRLKFFLPPTIVCSLNCLRLLPEGLMRYVLFPWWWKLSQMAVFCVAMTQDYMDEQIFVIPEKVEILLFFLTRDAIIIGDLPDDAVTWGWDRDIWRDLSIDGKIAGDKFYIFCLLSFLLLIFFESHLNIFRTRFKFFWKIFFFELKKNWKLNSKN